MNSNRGQYNSAPLYNMKNRRRQQQEEKPEAAQAAPQPSGRRFKALSVIMSVVLPLLFLLSLLIPSNGLRWAFLAFAAVSLIAMWALGAFVKSARNTLTVVYGALAVVISLALFMNSQAPESRAASAGRSRPGPVPSSTAGSLGGMLETTEAPEENTDSDANKSAAQLQLEGFLAQWAERRVDEMVKYCQPAWVSAQTSPETTLYQMIQGSRPVNYSVERVEGSDNDSTRTITVRVLFDENNNQQVLKRLQVLMFRVNDIWYVGPQSLGGVVIDENGENAEPTIMPASTIAPTPTPNPNGGSGITVYYNTDGGKYYHTIPNCSWVDEKYWPLTGFSFDLINSQEFKNLVACPNCGAPARPSVSQ